MQLWNQGKKLELQGLRLAKRSPRTERWGLPEKDSQAQGLSGVEHMGALPLSDSAAGVATDEGP